MPATSSASRPIRRRRSRAISRSSKKELPVDILEFFYLTPLPGSEDHKKLYMRGVPMDPDMNKYDLEHACTAHPMMSKEELDGGLCRSVVALLHRRTCRDDHAPRAGLGINRSKILDSADYLFRRGADRRRASAAIRVFPAQAALRSAAHGMPVVNPLVFYPWRAFDFLQNGCSQWLRLLWRYRRIMARVIAGSGDGYAIPTRPCGRHHRSRRERSLCRSFRRQNPAHPRRAGARAAMAG